MTDDRSTYRVSVPQDRRWQFVSMAEGLGCEVVLKPSRFDEEEVIADGGQVRPLNYKKRKLLRVLGRAKSPPSTSALAGHIDSRARACRRQLMGLVDSGHVQRIDQPGLGGDRWRLQEGEQ